MQRPSNLPPGVTDWDIEDQVRDPVADLRTNMTESDALTLQHMLETYGTAEVLHTIALTVAQLEA